LRDMTGCVETCLANLSDEQVWERHAAHENTIANLMLHLCGNIRQWIMHGVANQTDVRKRDAEFSTASGFTRAELLALFNRRSPRQLQSLRRFRRKDSWSAQTRKSVERYLFWMQSIRWLDMCSSTQGKSFC
jgi:hypothetical protein